MQQLIDMCIETRDSNLYMQLCEKFKQEGYYHVENLQLLNDLVQNKLNSIIYNYLINYIQYDKLQINTSLDPLIIEQMCLGINTHNWKKLIIVFKLCQHHKCLYPINLNLSPLHNHLPSFIALQLLKRDNLTPDVTTFNNVYHVSQIIINNNIIHKGSIYIQSLTSAIYFFISNESILLEFTQVKYSKIKDNIILTTTMQNDNNWCLIGNLKVNNINTISFNLQSNNDNKYNNNNNSRSRISTSESVLRLGTELIPKTQDSLIITKCNVKSLPPNNDISKIKKPKLVPKKTKKPVAKKTSIKRLQQKQLNNVKPIVNIESSQLLDQEPKEFKDKEPAPTTTVKIECGKVINDDNSTTIFLPEDNTKEDSEEPINIHNPSINTRNTDNILSIPTNDFTNILQNQIQHSIDQFSQDLIKKIDLLNEEVNDTMLKPLAAKYQSRLNDLQLEFKQDIQEVIVNFKDLFTRLHWKQTDLTQFLQSKQSRAT